MKNTLFCFLLTLIMRIWVYFWIYMSNILNNLFIFFNNKIFKQKKKFPFKLQKKAYLVSPHKQSSDKRRILQLQTKKRKIKAKRQLDVFPFSKIFFKVKTSAFLSRRKLQTFWLTMSRYNFFDKNNIVTLRAKIVSK